MERRRGQAIIEMAIVLPLVLLLLVGVVDFGRVYYTTMTVVQAARAGAQYGAQDNAFSTDIAGMKQAALDAAGDVPGVTANARQYCQCASGASVSCTASCPEGVPQVYVEVTADKVFTTMMMYPGIPSTTNVARRATLRVQ